MNNILFLWIFCAFLPSLRAQYPPCASPQVLIYTGYDESAGTALSVSPTSTADVSWIVTTDGDPDSAEPRPAFAIPKNDGWLPAMPLTQWITSYPDGGNTHTGNYTFEFVFCLGDGFLEPSLYLDIRSDNGSTVYLNGHFLKDVPSNFSAATPEPVSTNNAAYFVAGPNRLTIVDHNLQNVKGINVKGFVAASSGVLGTAGCCTQAGVITGLKWKDINNDGIRQDTEPTLSGWEIKLSNGQTALTDHYGYYTFSNLPPGNYTVTETQQSGWARTWPASGNYSIALGPNEVRQGIDFGNRVSCGMVIIELDTACTGKPATLLALLSQPPLGTPVYSWDFGDGQNGNGPNPVHTYANTGNYTIQVTMTTSECSASFSTVMTVSECVDCKECIPSFAPIPGKQYVLSAWVKESNPVGKTSYSGPAVSLFFEPSTPLSPMHASGLIIDGWQRIESPFTVPLGTTAIRIKLMNMGTDEAFFDDIRVFPFDAGMKSFVYDPRTLRLMAELDERNYATFYEYNEEGALIRVKKETARGVKTIKESINNTQIKQ